VASYFCDPHSPWQKGAVENANGRVRRFLPREAEPGALASAPLRRLADRLNGTPRRCLGYQRVKETRLQPPGSGSKLTTSIAASVAVAMVRMTSAAPSAVARASRCAAARARNSRGVPAPTSNRMIRPRL